MSSVNVDHDRLRKASLENATSLMRQKGLQALLVTTMDNVRYITGDRLYFQFDLYVDQYAALLSAEGELIKWTFDLTAAGEHGWKSYPLAPASILADRWADIFAKALEGLKLHEGRIGLDCMNFATREELRRRLPKIEFLPAEEDLLRIRAVKKEDELRLMKKAARIVDIGLEGGFDMMKPGVTENELQARILAATQEAGSEGPSFFGFCSSGKRTLGDLLVTDRKLRRGDPAIFDVGAVFGGYCGDACRTGIVGKASKELRDLYVTLAEALRNGIAIVKPGIKASEIDLTIRQSLKESGYPDYPASSGHGLGLKAEELPWITSSEEAGTLDMTLEPGMVFDLEPTTYQQGLAAVRLEDEVLVTETGHEVLTKTRYEF